MLTIIIVADEILTVGLNNDYMKLPTLEIPKEKNYGFYFMVWGQRGRTIVQILRRCHWPHAAMN